MRLAPLVAVACVTATVLTGCGSSSSDAKSDASKSSASSSASASASPSPSPSGDASSAYCAELKADKTYFDSFANGDTSKIDAAFNRFHSLAAKAPSEVAADWKLIDTEITTVQNTLKKAGLTFSDLANAQQGKLPKGVTAAELQRVVKQIQGLDNAKFKTAGDRIEAHAKNTCGVDLSSS